MIYYQPHILQEKKSSTERNITLNNSLPPFFVLLCVFFKQQFSLFQFITTNFFRKTINQLTLTNQRNRTLTAPTNSPSQKNRNKNHSTIDDWVSNSQKISCYFKPGITTLISDTDMPLKKIDTLQPPKKKIFFLNNMLPTLYIIHMHSSSISQMI